jgi:hypothetical protein
MNPYDTGKLREQAGATGQSSDRIVRSKLTAPHKGFRYYTLRPLIVAKHEIEALYLLVVRMILAELLTGKTDQYSNLQHLLAFFAATAFSLGFFYLDFLEGISVAVFFGLWAVDRYAHVLFGSWYEERVITRIEHDTISWRKLHGATVVDTLHLPRAQVRALHVNAINLSADAFDRVQKLLWRVHLVTVDGGNIPVFESRTASESIKHARALATELKVDVQVAGTVGHGALAESAPNGGAGTFGEWHAKRGDDVLTMTGNTSLWRAFQSSVRDYGILFFVVIMADVLARFGHLVAVMFGPWLGLPRPASIHLDLSLSGIVSAVIPDLHWLNVMELSIALFLLAGGVWSNLGREKLRLEDGAAVFRDSNKRRYRVEDAGALEILRLNEPRPGLLFVSDSGDALHLDDLRSDSAQELFLQCDSWLRREARR